MSSKKIKLQTDFWTTRDGTHIRICEMDDNHLVNTIKLLEKRAEMIRVKYLISHFGIFTLSDAAQDCLDGEIQMIENMTPGRLLENFEVMELKREPHTANIYRSLCLEAKRRNLYDYEEEERIRSLFGVTLIGDFLK